MAAWPGAASPHRATSALPTAPRHPISLSAPQRARIHPSSGDSVSSIPGYIDFPADVVDLSIRLSRRVPLGVPCVSSPIDTVSEATMAAAMASLGATAVVHSNAAAETQASILRAAKSCRIPWVSSTRFFAPSSAPFADDFAS